MKEGETVHVTTEQIVAEIRQNPEMKKIAEIIENPYAQSLINLLITYEKYNYQTEEAGISQAINDTPGLLDDSGIFAESEEPVYKEIEMMRELVLEFGEVINKRIKDNIDQTFMLAPTGTAPAPG